MKYLMGLFCSFLLLTGSLVAEQKVVLISGATGGIGLAATKAFQKEGWKVWAGYRSEIPNDLKQLDNVRWVRLDVTDERMISEAVQMVLKEDEKIDALVNNAGYGIIGAEECVDIEEAQKLFDVNFFGVLRLIHTVVPHMRKQCAGHIINISSASGVRSVPGLGIYAASKFALEGLSESLAITLSPWNIRVSLVEPSGINNEWSKNCMIGKRPCQETIYTKLAKNLSDKLALWAQTAQSSDEVGALIVTIAQTSEPHVRYQTSPKVKEIVGRKLVDVTGDAMRDEQMKFFHDLVD